MTLHRSPTQGTGSVQDLHDDRAGAEDREGERGCGRGGQEGAADGAAAAAAGQEDALGRRLRIQAVKVRP